MNSVENNNNKQLSEIWPSGDFFFPQTKLTFQHIVVDAFIGRKS